MPGSAGKKQSIKVLLLYLIILPITFSIFTLLIIQSIIEYSGFTHETAAFREEYINARKNRIKTEVEHGVAIIRFFIEDNKALQSNKNSNPEDHQKQLLDIQNHILAILEKIESPDVGYLFGATWNGDSLLGPAKGQNMYEVTDINGIKVVQELINAAKAGGGYVDYVMPRETGKRVSLKISYVLPVPEWEWYIGAGVYVFEIETIIAEKLKELNKRLLFYWVRNLGIIIIILIITIMIVRPFSNRLTESFSLFIHFLKEAATHSLSINPQSLHYSELQEIAHYTNKMIVARIESEKALEESREQFKKIIDKMPVLLDAFDKNNRIIFWNEECERVTGYSMEEILKHPDPLELLYPDGAYRQKIMETYNQRGFYLKDQQWEITTKQGSKRTISWTNISSQFEIPGWHTWAIGIDVTDKQEMEFKLRQSEKLQAIGQLAGGIAHDFNNQLSAILGFTEVIEMMCSEDLRKYTANIIASINRASDLTQKLLAFARKGKFKSEYVEINHIIEEVVDILHHSIDKRIDIKTKLYNGPTGIRGDPTQIQNAFLNIAINARDAMPDGGSIIFQTEVVALDENCCRDSLFKVLPGNYIKISISDNGMGMDEETLSHIFEPFFTTKSSANGTGMGLAAVYGTIKNHKGIIRVKSTRGEGSCFIVCLPFNSEQINKIFIEPKVYKADKKRTILLIDDEEAVRMMIKEILINLGYSVQDFSNGPDAVEAYSNNPDIFDLVILDMIMPREGGREVFKNLKKINPNVKVILISGYIINEEVQSLMDQGAVDFLQKPFRRAELSKKLAEIFKE
ncbi:MAG: cache domain-containing protein [Spirochaetales bacterium]|nr:cache domain-containing protein [Spirochaetales bacterium]